MGTGLLSDIHTDYLQRHWNISHLARKFRNWMNGFGTGPTLIESSSNIRQFHVDTRGGGFRETRERRIR